MQLSCGNEGEAWSSEECVSFLILNLSIGLCKAENSKEFTLEDFF